MVYVCIHVHTVFVCLCTPACRCASMHICGHARDWYYASNNHFTSFFETASLTSWLDCLFSKFQGFSCLCLPHAGSTSTHGTVSGFLPGCLGSGLRCSCFHSKHLTNWAIFPASCLCPTPQIELGGTRVFYMLGRCLPLNPIPILILLWDEASSKLPSLVLNSLCRPGKPRMCTFLASSYKVASIIGLDHWGIFLFCFMIFLEEAEGM